MSPALLGRTLYPTDRDAEARARAVRQVRVGWLAAILGAVLLITTGPGDADWAGASGSNAEDEFHQWYSSDPRNASYFHIRQHFGDGSLGDQAVNVAQCESGLDPRAYNPSGASGVFQVMPGWAQRYAEVTGMPYYDERFNPDANAAFAAWLVAETGGWSHWVCRSGS